jgi:hypothetical protein
MPAPAPGTPGGGPRIIQEVITAEYLAGWGSPIERMKDHLLNHFARRKGERLARTRGLL